jgi:hypothetical protein
MAARSRDWRKVAAFITRPQKQTTSPIIILRNTRSKTVRQLFTLLFVCAILSGTTGIASAGTCTDSIKNLRQAAQLGHQPTPESVSRAQTYQQLMFAAALAQAEAQDVLGHEAECLIAARRAKEAADIKSAGG